MSKRKCPLEVTNEVNKFGSHATPSYTCVNPEFEFRGSQRIVKIKSNETGQVKITKYQKLKEGKNPFKFKLRDCDVKKIVNQLGKNHNPVFVCTNPNAVKITATTERMVEVTCLDTKEVKIVKYQGLKSGRNPFNKGCYELNPLHPKYKKLFNKLKIKFNHEFKLSSKRRIDFVLFVKDKVIGVEVKSSRKSWCPRHIERQVSAYKEEGLKQFKNFEVVLSDPKGSFNDSLTLNQLESYLKTQLA